MRKLWIRPTAAATAATMAKVPMGPLGAHVCAHANMRAIAARAKESSWRGACGGLTTVVSGVVEGNERPCTASSGLRSVATTQTRCIFARVARLTTSLRS